ncbi:hypothetical protein GCM10010377_51330 [Streptomyces viridiviolaceus]|uniref:Uncharacterized protein n=1 Tax=Streptomyces viridiviolaceus TaxID=68282 RepID=A0ABW2E8D9_9ACTN|nr:hypothetical protein [Streptomyces viridiviolaceus]GHB54063.1 hypothetical protein GCM10010377_51330 [Streptomyces viridiviolaceus]
MNGRIRLAALAPLAVSSLALGSVPFTAGSAQAVAPSATCHVTQSANSSSFNVVGQGLTPGASVTIRQGGLTVTQTAGADGGLQGSLSVGSSGGPVTMQEQGGPRLRCGTVKQAEQKQGEDQFTRGFQAGFAAARQTCQAQLPQAATAPDPNFERGFKAGADAAIARFC